MTSASSGKFVLRLPPALHGTLRAAARAGGVSLNEYCVRRLAAGGPGLAADESAAAIVTAAAALLGDSLVAVVVYGSWVRGEATTASDVERFLRASDADVVHLEPADGRVVEPDGLEQLVALCARQVSPVVGPRLVSDDGRLVSAGRVNRPTFGDLFQGTDADDPGPWGAFAVTREVSSISPLGAVLDRRAVLAVGGFDIGSILTAATDELGEAGRSLDLTMAVLGAALQRAGTPALWSPLMTIVLPARYVLDAGARLELAEQHLRLTERWPFLADEPYSPIGVHHP